MGLFTQHRAVGNRDFSNIRDDSIKIDRSFIRGITTNLEDASIAAMIISLAHSLSLKVIAEGVETLRQAAVLQNKGCAEMQGYYFSPPLPARTLTTLFITGNGIIATRV